MSATLKKIELPLLDNDGTPATGEALELAKNYWRMRRDGREITEAMQAKAAEYDFPNQLDTADLLKKLVERAINPQAGMPFSEIEKTRVVIDQIEATGLGGAILMPVDAWKFVCEKVRLPYLATYNRAFDVFVQSVLSAPDVPVAEVVPNTGT